MIGPILVGVWSALETIAAVVGLRQERERRPRGSEKPVTRAPVRPRGGPPAAPAR